MCKERRGHRASTSSRGALRLCHGRSLQAPSPSRSQHDDTFVAHSANYRTRSNPLRTGRTRQYFSGNFGLWLLAREPKILRTMRAFARTLPACLAGVLAAILLGACATGMSKDECALADWQTIGYEDGLRGFPAERIGAHRVACAKHQVTPNLAAYSAGRERGLREFCQPKNGFRAGLHGGGYANVCSGSTETAFVDAIDRAGRFTMRAPNCARQTRGCATRARSCAHECRDGQRHCRTRVTGRADRAPHLARDGTRATDTAAQ